MNKNYLVTKSNYFIMNSSYDLSLEEQKIILTLASMVQPKDEDFKPYKFKINDFMELLGVETKTKYTEIPRITKELMKKVFEIKEGKKITQVAWLSSATYEKGSGIVELEFSPKLKPYMLNLNTMFTQYKLANILSMKSKYSPRIYEILKCNEFKKQGYMEIEIEELRKLLKADNIYPLYANFKQKLLIPTQKDLNLMSDISFDFEEIKTGRKVTALRFYIHQNRIKPINNTMIIEEVSATVSEDIELEREDINKIIYLMKAENIKELDAIKIYKAANGDINKIQEKYNLSKSMPGIKNIVGWMIKAIQEDYHAIKGKGKIDNFNNFEQRQYDFEDLERKFLGWDNEE